MHENTQRALLRSPAARALLALALAACSSAESAHTPERAPPARASLEETAPPADAPWTEVPRLAQEDELAQLDLLTPDQALEQLLARAALANPGAEAAFHRWQAALERPAQARALPNPRLYYRYYIEQVETRVGPQEQGLGLVQSVPWPDKLSHRSALKEAEARVAEARWRAALSTLFEEVETTWAELWHLERSIEAVRGNAELVMRLEGVVSASYSAGEARFASLLRAQVERGRLEDRLLTLTDRRRPVIARMNALLGRAADAPLTLPSGLPSAPGALDGEALAQRALEHDPELEMLRRDLERSNEGIELARVQRRPDFHLGLDWIDTGPAVMPNVPDSGQDAWIASIGLDLPIWFGSLDAAEREARSERRAALLVLEERMRDVAAMAEDALYRERDAARRELLYADELLPRARQTLEALEVAFRGGEASFLDLVDAERVLLEFELELARARADRRTALAALGRMIGERLLGEPAEGAETPSEGGAR